MILIIGGAYQGKRDFAKTAFHLKDEAIFTCQGSEIDFSAPCIDHLEEFTLACVREGKDACGILKAHMPQLKDTVLICQDIFCGVVPMEADYRAWRNVTGQLCQYLSREANRVSRIFCGLEQRLK